jgi:hypothetical protein
VAPSNETPKAILTEKDYEKLMKLLDRKKSKLFKLLFYSF